MTALKKTDIPGLFFINNFLTDEESSLLFDLIEKGEWSMNRSNTRRIQIYGPIHDSKYKTIYKKGKIQYTPHPYFSYLVIEYIKELLEDVPEVKKIITDRYQYCLNRPNSNIELFVNEYMKDSQLRQHYDHRTTYQECIIGISILSDVIMTFTRGKKEEKVLIPRKSIYFMTGDSRYKYKHGIDSDGIQHKRISLTLRMLDL